MTWRGFSKWKERVGSFLHKRSSAAEEHPDVKKDDHEIATAKLPTKDVSAVKSYRRSHGLGRFLIEKHLATKSQIEEALLVQKERRSGESPGAMCDLYLSGILVDLGYVDENELAKAFSVHWQIPVVRLSHAKVRDELVDLIPSDLARRFGVFPYDKVGKVVIVVVFDPTMEDIMTYIAKQIGYNVKPTIGIRSDILRFLDAYYSVGKEGRPLPPSKKTREKQGSRPKWIDPVKPAMKEKPVPREASVDAGAEKKEGMAVAALEVDHRRFTGLAEITLHQQAETWITGKASVEKEAIPVDPALIALFTEGRR